LGESVGWKNTLWILWGKGEANKISHLICLVCAWIDFNLVSLLRTTHDSV
jgi:hypothetical protein